ncbi:SPOR domain-containing protein [Pedobacter alpinus]|uniref:SPOR domain-containing protein n=1 Tax=Pedobacter alpinus TaxID=1590643 RepID=A0ABW5TUW5_9SPHI
MDISAYLVELIVEKDHVTVPGLGKFLKKRTNGYYDSEAKIFYPPSGEIVFSTDYMHDDKLVHLISQKTASSLTNAYAILDEYIREIKVALKTSSVVLKGIGELKHDDGKLLFQSEKETNVSKAYFGLPPVDTQSERLIGKDSETYSLAQQALNTSFPDEYLEDEQKRGWVAITMGIIAVAALTAIIGLYFAKPNFYKDLINQIQTTTVKPSTTPVLPLNKQLPNVEAVKIADSIYNSTDVEGNLKAQGFEVEKVKDSTNISINKKVVPAKGKFKYEIIIGLYPRREDAVKRVSQLKANGIDAHIVDDEGAGVTMMTKISGATLYNDADAEKELQRILQELNPQAYKLPILILK